MTIGASIFFLALGAILAFAVTLDSTPLAGMTIEWSTIGVILMIVGAIGLIYGIMAMNAVRRSRTDVVVDDVHRDRIVDDVHRDRIV